VKLSRRFLLSSGGLALILLIGLGLLLWSGGSEEEDRAWQQAQATGVLRVGMDAAYPPFEYVNEQNEIVGFDVDFASEIGRRLGFEMVFVNMAYDALYDALLIGQVEVVISALVAAPQFEGKAAFTAPYFNAGEYLVVREGGPIRQMADLDGHTLAVEYGSGGDVEARNWERRLADLTVTRYPDPGTALLAVVNGEADATLVDGITARLGVGEHPELVLADNVVDTLYVVAVHPDSTTLHARIDEVIWEMLHDGTVSDLIEEWFGPQRAY
jgi:ABC-type amino acid transport substrate-binding protein